jgi:hypothetical protein
MWIETDIQLRVFQDHPDPDVIEVSSTSEQGQDR